MATALLTPKSERTTIQYTQYTQYNYTLYTVRYVLHTVRYILYTVRHALYTKYTIRLRCLLAHHRSMLRCSKQVHNFPQVLEHTSPTSQSETDHEHV